MTIGSLEYAQIQIDQENEEWKNWQRLRVYDFILGHADKTRPLTFMCLPGVGWKVEHSLVESLPNGLTIFGCEVLKQLIPHSLDNMPGEDLERKIIRLTNGRKVEYWKTDTAYLFRQRLSTLLAMRPSDFVRPVDSVEFYGNCGNADLIWIDGVGQLCPDTRKMLTNIHKMMNLDTEYVPAVFTFSSVRATRGELLDKSIEDVDNQRIVRFKDMLRECCTMHDIVDFTCWPHRSSKTRMLNMQFLFKLRR